MGPFKSMLFGLARNVDHSSRGIASTRCSEHQVLGLMCCSFKVKRGSTLGIFARYFKHECPNEEIQGRPFQCSYMLGSPRNPWASYALLHSARKPSLTPGMLNTESSTLNAYSYISWPHTWTPNLTHLMLVDLLRKS